MLMFFNIDEYKINDTPRLDKDLFVTILSKNFIEYILFERFDSTYKVRGKILDSKTSSIELLVQHYISKYTKINMSKYELKEVEKYNVENRFIQFEYILDKKKDNVLGYYVFFKGKRISNLFKDKLQAQTYIDDSAEYLDEISDEFEIVKVIRED